MKPIGIDNVNIVLACQDDYRRWTSISGANAIISMIDFIKESKYGSVILSRMAVNTGSSRQSMQKRTEDGNT